MEGNLLKSKKMLYLSGMTAAAAVLYLAIKYILPLFLPFMLAYLLAWLVRGPARAVKRLFKIPQTVGAAVLIILCGGLLFIIAIFLIRTLAAEIVRLMRNFPVYRSFIENKSVYIFSLCDRTLGLTEGSSRMWCSEMFDCLTDNISTQVIPNLTKTALKTFTGLAGAVFGILTVFVSALLWVKEADIHNKYLKQNVLYNNIHVFTKRLCECGFVYIRTQLIIAFIIAVVCTAGFFITGSSYPYLYGILVAVVDAFPVLGSGTVLVPVIVVMVINKNIFAAAVFSVVFLLCQLAREFLEPKMLGSRLGVPGIYMLMAVFIGVRLFGISGIITGPAALVAMITIHSELKRIMGLA